MSITDPTKIISDLTDVIDDNVYSRQEQEEDRTERLKIDLQSDNQLAKMARPIMAYTILIVWSFVIIASIWIEIDQDVRDAVKWSLTAVLGFYFVSRGMEKVNSKKLDATIKLERMKTRAQIRQDKRESRKQ